MNTKNLLKKSLFICLFSFLTLFNVLAQTVLTETPVKITSQTEITLDASLFEDITAGNYLTFSFKNTKAEDHELRLYAGSERPLSYGALKDAESERGTIYPYKSSGKFSYILVARDISAIKEYGLTIKGQGLQINKIIYEPAPEPKVKKTKKASAPTIKVKANPAPVFQEGTPFAEHGKLSVKGAYLKDKNGKDFMLYGMSTHGLAWFPKYVNKEGFKTLRDDWNTNCVRLALYTQENGGYCAGGNQEQLKDLIFKGIDAATELGMYVIVDWHVLSYNPNQNLNEAMLFFSEISQKYAKYGNVIYELCNEPTGSPWSTQLKPYAENLIPVIRKNAPDALIIVGTNTWSQDIHEPAIDPLKFKNIMYAFHFYADTHRDSFRERVEDCIKGGLPVFITEFGTCNASGNGGFNVSQTQKWFDLIKEYNISHMNWSLANKAETASVISSNCPKTSNWNDSDLTESGNLIRNHFKELNQ